MSDANEILSANRQDYAAILIATYAFGAYTVTAALSIHLLLQRRPSRSRRIALAYTYFMLVVTILWYAFSAKTTEAQILESSETDYCARDNIIGTVFSTLQFIGSDALLLYRAYTIFNRSLLAVAFPAAVFLAFLGSSVAINLACIGTQFGGSLPLADINDLGTAFYILSAGANVLVTVMIAFKLLLHQRSMSKLGFESTRRGTYISTVGLLVESAAAYSASNIIFVCLFETNNPIQSAWSAVVSSMSFLAQAWIILRVSMGTAYTSENVNEENLDTHGPSGVNFARRSALESTMASTRTTTSRTGDAMLLRNLGSKEEAGFRPELASASAEELGVVRKLTNFGHAL